MASKRKIILIIISIIVGLFLLAGIAVGGLVIFVGSKAAKEPLKKSPIKLQAWTDKSKNSNQTYEVEGLRITINNVRKAAKESGLEMPSGSKRMWIILNLTVKNISGEIKDRSTVDVAFPMKIIDSKGNEFIGDGGLLSDKNEPLIFEEIDKLSLGDNKRLLPQKEATGNIWFDISEKSTELKLYRDTLLGEKLTWPLI